MTRCED